jgi:hypothetical protein
MCLWTLLTIISLVYISPIPDDLRSNIITVAPANPSPPDTEVRRYGADNREVNARALASSGRADKMRPARRLPAFVPGRRPSSEPP